WTTSGGTTPGYDKEDRLTYWERSTSGGGAVNEMEWPVNYGTSGLTLVGDWKSVLINGTSQSRTHDQTHQLTAIGATSQTFDAKGNQTEDTQGRTFTWDFDNRLASADASAAGGEANLTFTYT